MIGAIKSLLKSALPLALYFGTLAACFISMRGQPLVALAIVTIASPLPNLWYQLHAFPFGKDIIDLLVVSGMIGVFVGRHAIHKARNGGFLIFYLLATYAAVWHASVRFDLALPITPSSTIFVDWKNYAQMVVLYFLAFHSLNDEKRQHQLMLLAGGILFFIALREVRNFHESTVFSYDRRAAGPFWAVGLNANSFGAFIVHFGAFFLAVAFFTKSKYERWFLLLTAFLCIKPIFFSYSRGAYLAALAVLFMYGVLKKRSLLVLIGIVVISWQTLLPATVVERITMTETAEGQLEESAADRVMLWEHSVDTFVSSPIFGVGMGGFAEVAKEWGNRFNDPHNYYLKTAVEQGVFGVALFLLLLGLAMRSGIRLYRHGQTGFQKGIGLGMLGCTVAIVITNIFGDRWSYFAPGAYFWLLWGMVDRALTNLESSKVVARSAATHARKGAGADPAQLPESRPAALPPSPGYVSRWQRSSAKR